MTDYRQHPEYLALMETVLRFPEDDAPRGILADWIQEAGDDERAGFIREQLKHRDTIIRCAGLYRDCLTADNPVRCEPCQRAIADGLPPFLIGFDRFGFTRGFVSEIHLERDLFLEHAATLFARYPITDVIISRSVFGYPHTHIAHWELGKEIAARLPGAITDKSRWGDYNRGMTLGRALEIVSAACVSYGREAAGLPMLT